MEYSYPLDLDWSTEEMIAVTHFYQTIEKGYESGVTHNELQTAYQSFKEIVPSKAEEKTLFNAFEKASSYHPWGLVKQLKDTSSNDIIKK